MLKAGTLVLLIGLSAPEHIASGISYPPVPSLRDAEGEHQKPANQERKHDADDQEAAKPKPLIIQIDQPKGHEVIATKPQEEGEWYTHPDWWVAVFTGALFVATGGLWFFTALLWIATRKSVKDAGNGVAIANASLEHAKLTAKRQLRAYVLVDSVDVEDLGVGQTPKIVFTVKNFGQTPALNIRMCGSCALLQYPNSDWPPVDKKAVYSVDLGPGATHMMPMEFKAPLTVDAIQHVRTGDCALYAVVTVEYEDIFGTGYEECFKQMCREKSMFDRAAMGPYNESVDV